MIAATWRTVACIAWLTVRPHEEALTFLLPSSLESNTLVFLALATSSHELGNTAKANKCSW